MATTISIAPAVERFLQLRDVKARVLEAGPKNGYPTLLLHGVGYTSGGEQWLPAIREGLAEKLHVFALDNIGWGGGDRPTFEYSLGYFVDFLREVQDALGYEKTNLVGHSLGGWIAALFAYESPNRLNKLILESIAGGELAVPQGVADFKPPTREQVREQVGRMKELTPEEREAEFEVRWRNMSHPNAEAAYRQIRKHLNDPAMRVRYNILRRLPHIHVPTLVDWGSNAPPGGSSLAWGHEIVSRIPGAKWNLIQGAGHGVPQDKPKEWARIATAFFVE